MRTVQKTDNSKKTEDEDTKKRVLQGWMYPVIDDQMEENSSTEDEGITEDSEISTPSPQSGYIHRQNIHPDIDSLNEESYSNRMSRRPHCTIKQERATIPKRRGPSKNSASKNTNSKNTSLFWLVGVFIILLSFFLWHKNSTESPSKPDPKSIKEELERSFKQPDMSFCVVHSALKNVFKENPNAPAIIILLTSKGAENESHQFALKLAKSVSQPEDYILINGSTYKSLSTEIGKKKIDNTLNNNLSNDKIRAVLVDRLDNLSGKCALMLHSFCDHENAPFKRAVFVMTVLLEEVILEDSRPKDWDVMLQNHLKRVWSDIGEDQVTPLLSRLSVSVAAIVKNL